MLLKLSLNNNKVFSIINHSSFLCHLYDSSLIYAMIAFVYASTHWLFEQQAKWLIIIFLNPITFSINIPRVIRVYTSFLLEFFGWYDKPFLDPSFGDQHVQTWHWACSGTFSPSCRSGRDLCDHQRELHSKPKNNNNNWIDSVL